MRKQLTAFMVAIQFLTTCPPILHRIFEPVELGRALGYFPLVGALLGLALAGLAAGLGQVFPAGVVAALALVAWVLMTGSLHVDGFLDACDGLFGGFTADERLRIMRDERVGGYALSGGVLLFVVKYAALASLAGFAPALVLAPVLGRWAMAAGVVAFPYARAKGLGRDMKDQAHTRQLILATAIALVSAVAIAWLSASYVPLLACAGAAIATVAVARFTMQRIPGLTGDIYGALCEVVEVCVLLAFVAGAA